jgi:hypothetical protein
MQNFKSRAMLMVKTIASQGKGMLDLRETLIRTALEEFMEAPPILGDMIDSSEMVFIIVPIDLEAPKGRLILSQVQCIRDVRDHDSSCLVVKGRELQDALNKLQKPPALAVTDSQAFLRVAYDVPTEVPLTSFSNTSKECHFWTATRKYSIQINRHSHYHSP